MDFPKSAGRWLNQTDHVRPGCRSRRRSFTVVWCRRISLAVFVLLLSAIHAWADNLGFESIPLPALRISGQAARAHTQGLEVIAGQYYVTARREDVTPKQALLLRTTVDRKEWDVWDLTPLTASHTASTLDHPGGFQSDGNRLWIPLAESKPKGRSLIRVFPIASLVPHQPLQPEMEFPVDDHIGAVAVSVKHQILLGANWGTEVVYVWDLRGKQQRILEGPERMKRGLGAASDPSGRGGLAVQDWKFADGYLYASGLRQTPHAGSAVNESQLLSFVDFLQRDSPGRSVDLPPVPGIALAREGMAMADGWICFLPGDLGATNQLFRISLKAAGGPDPALAH